MADIDLKTETPDTSLPTTGFLFGADSQSAASPSVYSTQAVATALLGSTSLTGATVTTSQPVLDLSQTWNAGAVTFTGLLFNAATGSNTNSAAGSLLMDLQLEGTSRFSVKKSGQIDAAWNGLQFLRLGSADYQVYNGANRNLIMGSNAQGLGLNPAWSVSWSSSSTDAVSLRDLLLTRRAAANLRLGAADVGATTATVTITIASPGVVTWNSHGLSTGTPVVFTTDGALPTGITAGTTYYAVVVGANTFQLASSVANAIAATPTVITTSGTQSGTHTGTRYNITQRLGMQSVTGVTDRLGADLIIQGSQGTGTGAGGSIVFQVAPAGSTGTAQNALATAWSISGAGHFLAGADNTYDIGASGANRPRNVYVGTSLSASSQVGGTVGVYTASTGVIYFNTRAKFLSPADSIIRLSNNAETDFDRLQFGGTTSSFPALKRNSTALETKLADDSAYAPHAMQYLDVTDGITAPASATGRARIYVDTADGDLKVIFADGTVKTIVTDT